jgi:hypothetical protein
MGKEYREWKYGDNWTKGIREKEKGTNERKWEGFNVRTDDCTCSLAVFPSLSLCLHVRSQDLWF